MPSSQLGIIYHGYVTQKDRLNLECVTFHRYRCCVLCYYKNFPLITLMFTDSRMTVEKDKSEGVTVGQPHLAKQVLVTFICPHFYSVLC